MLYMNNFKKKELYMARRLNNGSNQSQKMEEIAMKNQKILRILRKACKLALLILLILGPTSAW